MTAHQRRIRDALAREDPRPGASSLVGYRVALIARAEAVPVIERYEWLGTVGKPSVYTGLLAPNGELHGVALFGHGPAGRVRDLIGAPALCLERGACVHYAPRNAASYLINAACRLVQRETGTARFFAYGDPEAGEYGAVYQAAGWRYLGQGRDGTRERPERYAVLPPGMDPANPANWKSTRLLRRGERLGFEAARARGFRIEKRAGKHLYATCVGPERRSWCRSIPGLPYPKPGFFD